MDPAIPGRLRTIDFDGAHDHLESLLGIFGSSHSSNASSIRLHVTPYSEQGPQERTTAFLSLSFPKLSKLDIRNFLPDSSSSIFTTSNLISLKLGSPHRDGNHYTPSRFSKMLQRHSNLQELHLWQSGIPQARSSGSSVPIVLPRLVDLQLDGTAATIAGFLALISMSSPLHNVTLHFEFIRAPSIPTLVSIVKKILAPYYKRQGVDYPRKASHLTISNLEENFLAFNVESRSTSASHPTSNLELRFNKMDNTLAEKICLLFPLGDVLEFAAVGLDLPRSGYRELFQRMVGLSCLRLDGLDIGPVLGELGFAHELRGVQRH